MALTKGRYSARQAETSADMTNIRALRMRCFGPGGDSDAFDPLCAHIMILRESDQALVCSFRMMPLTGRDILASYSAQFYALDALEDYRGKMVEMGRFCVSPDASDPDILRVAWGAMTAYVDHNEVELLFGCSSFAGIDTAAYLDAFAILKARHLAPKRWLPRAKAPHVFNYAARLRRKPDAKKAMLRMPPLLRTYLLMGGWVSDHAVVDQQMNTLHVFTGVEISAIPPARKRLLRALVGSYAMESDA